LDELADDIGESVIEALLAADDFATDDVPVVQVAEMEPESEPVEAVTPSEEGPANTDQRAESAPEAELASEAVEEAAGGSAKS